MQEAEQQAGVIADLQAHLAAAEAATELAKAAAEAAQAEAAECKEALERQRVEKAREAAQLRAAVVESQQVSLGLNIMVCSSHELQQLERRGIIL